MSTHNERLRNRLWTVNGVLLFVTLIAILGLIAYALMWDGLFGDKPVAVRAEPASGEGTPSAVVRFGRPASVAGTDVRMIAVRGGPGKPGESASGLEIPYGLYGRESDGPLVNVLFFDPAAHPGFAVEQPADGQRQASDAKLQRAFMYDITADTTYTLGAIDSLALAAGRLVGGR